MKFHRCFARRYFYILRLGLLLEILLAALQDVPVYVQAAAGGVFEALHVTDNSAPAVVSLIEQTKQFKTWCICEPYFDGMGFLERSELRPRSTRPNPIGRIYTFALLPAAWCHRYARGLG